MKLIMRSKLMLFVGIVILNFNCFSQEKQTNIKKDTHETEFQGKIAKSYEDSEEDWPERAKASEGVPNIMIILLDDVGFAQFGANGGSCFIKLQCIKWLINILIYLLNMPVY